MSQSTRGVPLHRGPSWAACLLAMVAAVGCGTVCDDASAICGFDVVNQPEECAGVTECAALCIVDYEACDVNDPSEGESMCITTCVEAEGG